MSGHPCRMTRLSPGCFGKCLIDALNDIFPIRGHECLLSNLEHRPRLRASVELPGFACGADQSPPTRRATTPLTGTFRDSRVAVNFTADLQSAAIRNQQSNRVS